MNQTKDVKKETFPGKNAPALPSK